MKIQVTQKHIDDALIAKRSGTYCCLTGCPIARAVKRHFPDNSVHVGMYAVSVFSPDYKKRIHVQSFPDGPVFDFINNFDMDRPVEPFEFELDFK